MRATATPAPIRKDKRRLLESCAIAASLIALAHGGPAMAQVAGSGTVTTLPSGASNGTGANPSTVNVDGPQSIINWTPSNTPVDGVIDFLPSGNTLNFVGNTAGYIVLNRFTAASGASITDQIALNGTVNSFLDSTTGARGGNIWFQNAGGILIGSSGVINVGSLVLTANDIDTSGGLLGPGNTIRFRGAPNSIAAITVNGAINANNAGDPGSSYVALVAPRVVQAGAVRVDGSAAYVAAEQADIRINSGLFDINVTVGAQGGNAITHTGSTTGPAHQQGDTDQSRIYMVAIPKNDAVTMLVSGQVGYDDALSAQVDPDGAVRLSAGYNVTNGELNGAPVNATAANITVSDTLFNSSTLARASGAFAAQAQLQLPASPGSPSQGRVFVEGNGTFIGDASATFNVGTGQVAGATGTLTIQSGGTSGTPGNTSVNVNGGQLGIGGDLVVVAPGLLDTATGNSRGGTASLNVSGGGLVTVTGTTAVQAVGTARVGTSGEGGDGRGGVATINVSGTGSMLLSNSVFLSAIGTGGGVTTTPFATTVADVGGDGFGGNVNLVVENGGNLSINSILSVLASGRGQIGLTQSGNGQGGVARIAVTGAGSSFQTPATFIAATGAGGGNISIPAIGTFDSLSGGNGQGGQASIAINADATSTINFGDIALGAAGTGGNAAGENSVGGNGRGGTASLTGTGGATVQLNNAAVTAAGVGGGAGSPSGLTSSSGDGIGGIVNVTATGGTTLAIDASLTTTATGLSATSDNLGSGDGGTVLVSATNGGNINVNDQLIVDVFGGSFGPAVFAQTAGSGTGGDVDLTAGGSGAIRADSYLVNASAGVVNVTGTSGVAQGGTIDVTASSAGQILVTNDGSHFFDTSAITGVSAGGSSATGGTIQFIANGGGISMGAGATLAAGGVSGGAINPGPNNPLGRGGTILIRVAADAANSSAIGLGNFNAASNGLTAFNVEGSGDIPRDTAGSGQGGTVSIEVQGGTLTASGINASANGFGGGTAGGAGGGVGSGGNATFTQTGGTATVGDMTISADGFGGIASGQSGPGTGGTATIDLLGGTITAADIVATAGGFGGDGSDGNDDDPANIVPGGLGGAGQGGTAAITIDGAAVVDASIILASAVGSGGTGGEFFNAFSSQPGTPGNGGGGTGGNAAVHINGGTTTASSVIADASGIGGGGGGSFFSSSSGGATGVGVGGRGGTGQGGTATLGLQTAIAGVGNAGSVAQGVGGNGGDHNVGGAGGDGFGGLAQAIVTNFDAGQLAVTLDSSGLGGNGGDGRDGAGGNGGGGNGGVSRILADGPDASLTAVGTNFITGGTGGNGGNGQLGFGSFALTAPSGGFGGDGRGGAIEIAANEGGTVTLGIVNGDAVVLGSTGIGGNGGTGSGSAFDAQAVAGDGGFGGAGTGGTVRLITNGGTITSNTESVEINAGGVSGTGGAGGIGNGGGSTGAAGGAFGTTGGRVVIAALNGLTRPGAITLGNTDINANGDVAGRIELRAEGNISFLGLDAEASGFADPTNNNTDVAPAGIFLALNGGTISSQGDVSLTTGSSVGAYAQSNGIFDVDGSLTIDATDQIDIRHDFREGAAPTIRAGDSLTATAGGISGAPGSLLGSGDTLSLTSTLGAVGVDRLDGVNIIIDAAGAASVGHAETTNDFTATAASFRTGLDSIITGGDISITSPGAVDLGNSTAGGSVSVQSQTIAFNNVAAGTIVVLRANGFGADDGITGVNITAGRDILLEGRSVGISGTIDGGGALSASAGFNGNVAIGLANADGDIRISAGGNLTGVYRAGGNVGLNAGGNITAEADATGTYVDPATGLASEGRVFADADGNLTMTGSSAATMFAARAGGSVMMQDVSAGEDVFVLAGTTANLTAVTAGDDLNVQADGGIVVSASQTTGAGPDGRSIVYQACCSNPSPFLQIQTSTADLSNVTLLAPTSTIGATNVTAFDNFTATAGGVVTATGLIRSGLATTIAGSSLDLVAITAGTDITLTANSGGISSTGALAAGHDVGVTATGAVNVSEFDAGDDIRVTTNGALTIGGAYSYGTGTDNEGDGSNIILTGGVTDLIHAEADNDFVANVASFTTGLNSIITGGDIIVTSPGAVDLGNSTAGGSVSVGGQSIAFNAINAGSAVSLNANDDAPGAVGINGGSITAGDDVDLNAARIAITGTVSGTGSLFANGFNGPVAINLADVDGGISIAAAGNITGTYNSGGNIRLNSGANINATANAIGSQNSSSGPPITASLFADAAGDVVLANSSASGMFGVNADGSVTLTGVNAGEDVFANAGTNATLTNITAGDDLTVIAPGGITANGLTTTGAGPDNRTLSYGPTFSGVNDFLVVASPADQSNIALTAAAGNIGGGNWNAFDNLTAAASGTVTTTGLLRSGLATNISGSTLSFAAITAGTDIGLTANTGGISSTGALTAGRDVRLTAVGAVDVSELGAGDDIRVNTGGALTIGGAYSYGTGVDTEGDGSNIALTAGITNVTHAEAGTDFFADVARFSTGLNSIIAGRNIVILSVGAIDLGNATAGRSVLASGQSITFNAINAVNNVTLDATSMPPDGGIRGNSIDAGGDIFLDGGGNFLNPGDSSIALTGTATAGGSFTAYGGAAVSINRAIAGDIVVVSMGDMTGTYVAGGNVLLFSDANITASAVANGGYIGPNGISEGYIFADARGNATLTNSRAATMLGVRAGESASLSNATAGEDALIIGGKSATLTNVTAGDDLTVRAGGINAARLVTTGDGPDGRTLTYDGNPGYRFTIATSAPGGSNIDLTSSANGISLPGGTRIDGASAFDNLTMNSGGFINSVGALQSGLATNIAGAFGVSLATVTAGTDIAVTSSLGDISTSGALAAGRDINIAGGAVDMFELDAGDDIGVSANGALTIGNAYSRGTGPDNEGDGSNISLGGGVTNVAHAEADGFFAALTTRFTTGLDSIIAGGDIFILADGAANLGNSTAGGAVTVSAQSIAFNSIGAGTSVELSANGTASGAEGINGGSIAAGGDIRLTSAGNINASATAGGTTADGSLFVDAGGNVILANSAAARMFGVNAGGSATITDGTAGEDMLVRTGTTASLTNVTAGDDVDIRAGSDVTANNVRATGTGADTRFLNYLPASGFTIVQGEGNSAVDGSDITATSGRSINAIGLSAGDDIIIDAASGIALDGVTTLGLGTTGGDSSIRTRGGATTLSGLDAFSDVIVDAAGLANLTGVVTAGRAATIDAQDVRLATLTGTGGDAIPTLDAGGNILVNSSAGITGGGVRAGGNTTLTASGAIAVTTVEGNSLALTGATGITADRVRSNSVSFTDTVSLDSSDGDIRIDGLSTSNPIDASANSIRIESGGSLRFTTLTTDVGDAYVRGVFSVENGNVAGTADFATTTEAMNIANLTAADAILVNSDGEMNLGTVTVADRLDANTLTTLGVTGVVTGRSIGLASADINIAPAGRVGTAGATQGVSITNNNNANQTFVGGTGTRGGYHIDAGELTRVFGTDIQIFAPKVQVFSSLSVGSATPPDVIVDSFTMTGGASGSNFGANGALTIRTPGKMRVIGNVQLTGLTDSNMLNLRADNALEVILGQGSVRLANGTNPAGQLKIVSGDIIVATSAAIADVGAATTTDAIETRLAQNDGILLDEGALFAGGIRATGNFYVQNSGSGTKYGQRRGLTFGAGGLDVVNEGPARIVINGVQIGPNGQITGLDVIPALTIGGSAATPDNIDPRSTFNGCLITGVAACSVRSLEGSFPVQDVIEEEADADSNDGDGNILPTSLITMRDLDPLSGEPLLDDPVTGAGNDDLWTPTLDACDPAGAVGGSCPAAE